MHKVNELSQIFLQSWKKFWTEYPIFIQQDAPAVIMLAEELAHRAGVSLDKPAGIDRVAEAIGKIADYCRHHKTWRTKNLYQINQAIQSVIIAMQDANYTATESQQEEDLCAANLRRAAIEREQREKDNRDESERSRKWVEENYTEEEDRAYKAYMSSIKPAIVVPFREQMKDVAKEAM